MNATGLRVISGTCFANNEVIIVKIVLIPISAGLFANWAMGKLRLTGSWRDRLLSFVAMGSICFIIGIIVALSRDDLLNVAGAVIAAAVLHNAIG